MGFRVLFGLVGLSVACGQIADDRIDVPSAGGTAGAGGGGAASGSGGSALVIPAAPEYSRDCIVQHLNAAPSMGGAPSDEPEAAPAGAAGEGGANVDLGVGAGDLTVLVIFDKSGSMNDPWDGRSKWQVANEAFMKAIEGVLANLTLGTILFPVPGGCEVAPLDSGLQIGFMTGQSFFDHWNATEAARRPDGSTPLEQALHYADMAIERGCALGLLGDRFRVVLVTDGEPTCEDDPAAITGLAAEWRELGIATLVLGLPGSAEATELLDAIALAGGTHQHQSLGTPTELDQGLYSAVR